MKKFLILFFLLVASPFNNAEIVDWSFDGFDVSVTWENAIVYVPGKIFTRTVNNVRVQTPMPVIVYLHGCGGISDGDKRLAKIISSEGFIVVMPDSFAMNDRMRNCSFGTYVRNLGNFPAITLRPAEAVYAIEQVREQEWFDNRNIFLMGHSEGAMTAFIIKDIIVNGIIITGYKCLRDSDPSTYEIPLLAINWESDPWLDLSDLINYNCSDRLSWNNRTNSQEIILVGSGHAVDESELAQTEVINFLNRWTNED